jgi:hypothetical protein
VKLACELPDKADRSLSLWTCGQLAIKLTHLPFETALHVRFLVLVLVLPARPPPRSAISRDPLLTDGSPRSLTKKVPEATSARAMPPTRTDVDCTSHSAGTATGA